MVGLVGFEARTMCQEDYRVLFQHYFSNISNTINDKQIRTRKRPLIFYYVPAMLLMDIQ